MNSVFTPPSKDQCSNPGSLTVEDPLQQGERDRLKKCEKTINDGLKEFFEVGNALSVIREERLYREEFATFAEYCEVKWDFSRIRAYQLISASSKFSQMLTFVNIPLPKNEAQLRPLLNVPEEEVEKTWREFIEQKGDEDFTAREIRSFVNSKFGIDSHKRKKRNVSTTNRNESLGISFELSNLLKELSSHVQQYEENHDLISIVEKLTDCADRIQNKCLCG